MNRLKITKPFEDWREEDLPEIYEKLRKKERAPEPGPEHTGCPCQCNAGWEAFLSVSELIMLKCESCDQWWLPSAIDDGPLSVN